MHSTYHNNVKLLVFNGIVGELWCVYSPSCSNRDPGFITYLFRNWSKESRAPRNIRIRRVKANANANEISTNFFELFYKFDRLNVCSSSPSYSITPKRTVSGRFSGQTARTALSVSSKNRPRPCASPPYSSVRLLACFEKKL